APGPRRRRRALPGTPRGSPGDLPPATRSRDGRRVSIAASPEWPPTCLPLSVREVGAIANPFGRWDHQCPGETVDGRGVGGPKPGKGGPGGIGGFAMISRLPQSLPRFVEFEALDEGGVGAWRPAAEVAGEVFHQMVAHGGHQLPRAPRPGIDRTDHADR